MPTGRVEGPHLALDALGAVRIENDEKVLSINGGVGRGLIVLQNRGLGEGVR